MPSLRLVVPAREAGPSGGDVYDARLAAAWQQSHGRAEVVALPGPWPRPGLAERQALARALESADTVLVDGLVGSPCSDEVARAVTGGTRVVLLIHLPLPAEAGLPSQEAHLLGRAEARSVRAASDVVVTSHWSARDVARRYGRRGVLVAAPGAVRSPVASGSHPPDLLVLGALTAVKNHAVLLPALAGLQDLPWRATFAGPAAAQPAVAERVTQGVRDAALHGRVALPGAVTGEHLEALWARTDLLLVPSLVETYGQVVTEALAHGIPALVAAGTGAVEALTGRPGADTVAATRADAEADDPAAGAGAGAATEAGATAEADDTAAGAALDATDSAAWEHALRRWLTTPGLRAGWRAAALRRRERLRTWEDTAADLRRGLFPGH